MCLHLFLMVQLISELIISVIKQELNSRYVDPQMCYWSMFLNFEIF